MHKKALYGLVIAGLISGTAMAGGPDMVPPLAPQWKPFVGVNYSYMSVDTTTGATGLPDSFNGVGFEGGIKYGRSLAFVGGYDYYFSQTTTSGVARPTRMYFDMRGYWPINNFDLIGSLGAVSTDFGPVGIANVDLKVGAGADYYFTPNWGVQVMWSYVPGHDTASYYDTYWTVDAGLYYQFS